MAWTFSRANGTRWYGGWTDPESGEQRTQRLPDTVTTRAQAEAFVAPWAYEREARGLKIGVPEAIGKFLASRKNRETRDFYDEKLSAFAERMGKVPLASWSRHDVAAFVAEQRGWGANTVRKFVVALRTFTRWCRAQRVPYDVADVTAGYALPKRKQPARFAWIAAERDAILRTAREREARGGTPLEVPAALVLYAGIDLPDIRTLGWENVETVAEPWVITGSRHKTGVDGRIPVAPELRGILDRHRATHGLVCRGLPKDDGALYHAFLRLQAAAKIPPNRRGGWKLGRRTCLTLLGQSGADLATIAAIARHASGSKETLGYLTTTEERKIAAITKASRAAGA